MFDLQLLAAQFVAGNADYKDIPGIATDATMANIGGAAMTALAGTPRGDIDRIKELLPKALAKAGVELPDETEALWTIARNEAAVILDGSGAPYDGAHFISEHCYLQLNGAGVLSPFAALAYEWQDSPELRREIEEGICNAARRLLVEYAPHEYVTSTERLGWPKPWFRKSARPHFDDDLPTATCHVQPSSEQPALCGHPREALLEVPNNPVWFFIHPDYRCDRCTQ